MYLIIFILSLLLYYYTCFCIIFYDFHYFMASYERLGSEVDKIFPSTESRSPNCHHSWSFSKDTASDTTPHAPSFTTATYTTTTTRTTSYTDLIAHCNDSSDNFNSAPVGLCVDDNVLSSSAPVGFCQSDNDFFRNTSHSRSISTQSVDTYSYYNVLAPNFISKSVTMLSTCTNMWPGITGFGTSKSAVSKSCPKETDFPYHLLENINVNNSIDDTTATQVSFSSSTLAYSSHFHDYMCNDPAKKHLTSINSINVRSCRELSRSSSRDADSSIHEVVGISPVRRDNKWLSTYGGANCSRCSCPGRCHVSCHCRSDSTSSEGSAVSATTSTNTSSSSPTKAKKSSASIFIAKPQSRHINQFFNFDSGNVALSESHLASDTSDDCGESDDDSEYSHSDDIELLYDTEDADEEQVSLSAGASLLSAA